MAAWILDTTRHAIYARDGHACVWCGRAVVACGRAPLVRSRQRATLDHVIPKSKGGTHLPTNLVTSCAHCNSLKGRLDLGTWEAKLNDLGRDGAAIIARAAKLKRAKLAPYLAAAHAHEAAALPWPELAGKVKAAA